MTPRREVVFALALVVGCVVTDGPQVFFSPRLAGDRTLSSLSVEEESELCEDEANADVAVARDPAALDAVCRARGNVAGERVTGADERRAACEAEYDACRFELSSKLPDTARCATRPPSTCSATIDEYAECANAGIAFQVGELDFALPCDRLDVPLTDAERASREAREQELVAAFKAGCARYAAKCPTVLD
jgi:hypothetical protein